MRFYQVLIFGALLLIMSSCEKCMKCSYTYTITTIQQTVNGEEEVVTTYTGYIKNTDSTYLQDECLKDGSDFTIDDKYILFTDTSSLDDINYTCTEL